MTSKSSKQTKHEVDMSPEAISARLEMVEQLRVLCLELGQAKPYNGTPTQSS